MIPHFRKALLIGSAVALLAGCAGAQYRDPYYRGPQRDGYYARGGDLVSRVVSDLDRARSYARVDHHERGHFDNARRDLLVFQDHYARGKFDKDRLDGAIDNIHHLIDSDQVNPRDRQMLSRDINALRDYRASRGAYGSGYRGYRY
jgi:hypothetical protein